MSASERRFQGPTVRRSLRNRHISTDEAVSDESYSSVRYESDEANRSFMRSKDAETSSSSDIIDEEEDSVSEHIESTKETFELSDTSKRSRNSISPAKRCKVDLFNKNDKSVEFKQNHNNWIFAVVLFSFAAILLTWLLTYLLTPTDTKVANPKGCDNLQKLRMKHPQIDTTFWSTLAVCFMRAFSRDPGEPSTFVLLYNSSSAEKTLLEDVTNGISSCIGNRKPVHVDSSYFKRKAVIDDYTVFINEHHKRLESEGILVVSDLDEVPASAANAFFSICDSYEPLIHRAIIFFTINMAHHPEHAISANRNPTYKAEEVLKKQWNHLHFDTLDPLVVRLTENVFEIY